ncbi:hypothetical protein LCGC14_1141060 [marine sediment metagenome]|uniref:Uncharacterized protein n=1 Tax=marine sediment metagenome TaxID=412755 RepID=A0A0F9Q3Z1_9ZZZZ
MAKEEMSFVQAASDASRIGAWIQCLKLAEGVLITASQAEDRMNRMKKEEINLSKRLGEVREAVEREESDARVSLGKRARESEERLDKLAGEIKQLTERLPKVRSDSENELAAMSRRLAQRREEHREIMASMKEERHNAAKKLEATNKKLAAIREKL